MESVAAGVGYMCRWCKTGSETVANACPHCGAPVDVKLVTTASGWEKLPAIADMTRLQIGQSRVQIEGDFVPVADFTLAPGDGAYFSHDSILWTDGHVALDAVSMKGGLKRLRGGLPLVLAQATGPGRIALSHDRPGEIVAVPIHAGTSVDVHEHHFLAATSNIAYEVEQTNVWFTTRNGDERETHYPVGRYMDQFFSPDGHGLLLLHAGGNAFIRDLAPGQSVLIKPPSLLYKDPSVVMYLHLEHPAASSVWGSWSSSVANRYAWLRLSGPGRVCVQSQYEHFEDPGRALVSQSTYTSTQW